MQFYSIYLKVQYVRYFVLSIQKCTKIFNRFRPYVNVVYELSLQRYLLKLARKRASP